MNNISAKMARAEESLFSQLSLGIWHGIEASVLPRVFGTCFPILLWR
jgi:hypothetical protein